MNYGSKSLSLWGNLKLQYVTYINNQFFVIYFIIYHMKEQKNIRLDQKYLHHSYIQSGINNMRDLQ